LTSSPLASRAVPQESRFFPVHGFSFHLAVTAVRFMITSGRPEFSAAIWPLVESADSQIYLSVMRAGRRFRPSVLGPDAAKRLAAIPDATRGHVLAELASRSGIEGMGLATAIAKADPNSDVQFSVVESLQFRRGDRHVSELLAGAHDEVWVRLAQRGYSREIANPEAAARLESEREKLVAKASASARLSLLLEGRDATPGDEAAIEEAIASRDFPARDQHAGSTIYLASERYPAAVGRAVLRRLADGLELPFSADEYLARVPPVDEGPVVAIALDRNTEEAAGIAASRVAGPKAASAMLDALVDAANRIAAAPDHEKQAPSADFHLWQNRLAVTPAESFTTALLARGIGDPSHVIGALGSLVSRHGSRDQDKPPLDLGGDTEHMIALVGGWAETLLANAASRRGELSNVASAIGWLGRPELLDVLMRLRDEDARRRRAAREEARAAGGRASIDVRSDAAMGYNLQYRDAFARLGEASATAMIGYLETEDFGFDAACVLKAIYDAKHGIEKPSLFKSWPHLPDAAARRAERMRGDTTYSDAVFAAVERLIAPGATDAQQALAIMIARVGLAMPHSDKEKIVAKLQALPQPVRTKRELVAALVLAGESFRADLALAAITAWVEDARKNTWRFREGLWEVVGWLELLPFSDRPSSVLDGVQMVLDVLPSPERMERVVTAAAAAPELSEDQLAEMLQRFPRLASEHEWAHAFLSRGTLPAIEVLIGLVGDGKLGTNRGGADAWWLAREIAAFATSDDGLKARILQLYEAGSAVPSQRVLEQVLEEIGGPEAVLALIRGYARAGKSFSGSMHQALEHTAIDHQPVSESSSMYNMHPVSIASLRKTLLAMLDDGDTRVAALAEECLVNIDYLRDYWGPAESEPRHPDIASGRPWPRPAAS
jgi:hypothetical protein